MIRLLLLLPLPLALCACEVGRIQMPMAPMTLGPSDAQPLCAKDAKVSPGGACRNEAAPLRGR